MLITGTHIAYLHTCQRKLWLFSHGIIMEHTSALVAEGKLIADTTYLDRSRKYTELAVEGIRIDYFDAKNKVVHEVKKSNSVEHAHLAQVKYYLAVLYRNGIDNPEAVIEYPKLKQRQQIPWCTDFLSLAAQWEAEVTAIMQLESCPALEQTGICKKCAYYDFCFAGE
jgi:CRISPR-associated exonuclease Cas4